MPIISVSLEERSYQVQVANGALDTLGYMAEKLRLSGKAAVITDSNVCSLYAERVVQSLRDAEYESSLHVFEAGEQSKNLRTVEEIVNEMVAAGHDRSSFIVALGGGVVGDMAGFIASIYYRGIPFIQVPTTVMAQVDSSVGGKTAVDTEGGKNLIGAFYQPKLVIADPTTLLTLSPRVLREGLAEIVKHAALREPKMLQTLQRLSGEIDLGFTLSTIERLPELIAQNIEIKARIVETDEKETKGVRAFLNLGHTLGHGIEASVPYGELLHGEVVSLGLRAALYLSQRYAGMPANDAQEVLRTLRALELPLQLPQNVNTAKALAKTASDKKFIAGAIRFVLLQGLGKPILSQEVTQEALAEAMHVLTTPTNTF